MRGPRAPWTPARKGLSHTTPLEGCFESGHDPSEAHEEARVTPDRGLPLHISDLRARVSRDRGRCPANPP